MESPKVRGPLVLNIGIDLGTSLTKVCWRDIAHRETGIVDFTTAGYADSFVPSVVQVRANGALSVPKGLSLRSDGASVDLLKMRLAKRGRYASLPRVRGIDLGSDMAIRALAAWFLGLMLYGAQQYVLNFQRELTEGREINWSANLGVPVDDYDSPGLGVFEEVARVAWLWAMDSNRPRSLEGVVRDYSIVAGRHEPVDIFVQPEIAAAIMTFASSRRARTGTYVYLDIGGGTLDGVAFHFGRAGGSPHLDCYSGKVADVGIERIVRTVLPNHQYLLRRAILSCRSEPLPARVPDGDVAEIQKLVAYVVSLAKKKDGGEWWRPKGRPYGPPVTGRWNSLRSNEVEPLAIYVGGGGSRSRWYGSLFERTHGRYKHRECWIPPYELRQIPLPKDTVGCEWDKVNFSQYAVAYGLAVDDQEYPEFNLPSALKCQPEMPKYRPAGYERYDDTE